jgi:dephospho-CoA kinase
MKVCGLTGGVGMGKSTAARFLHAHGAQIVDTDELARQLVEPGQPALARIQAAFGKKIVSSTGELKRVELAQIVFADAEARKKLEAILHPPICERWLAQLDTWRKENHPLAVVVIPLLFETRVESRFDKIICAACSATAQRERLWARGWTPEQIEQRNAAQMPIEQKIARADFVIWTDGALAVHSRQVDDVVARVAPAAASGLAAFPRAARCLSLSGSNLSI